MMSRAAKHLLAYLPRETTVDICLDCILRPIGDMAHEQSQKEPQSGGGFEKSAERIHQSARTSPSISCGSTSLS